MGREFDLIIFGATGYTGKHVVEEVVKMQQASKPGSDFTWAVGARSKRKLDEIITQVSTITGQDLTSVVRIVADVQDEQALKAMAARCTVLLSCIGPYRFFGEPVVKACVAAVTNYVDISGEPEFLERIQVTYHQQALEKHIYIVGSCGIDSIPADVGAVYLQDNFTGDLNSIDMFVEVQDLAKGKFHYSTYQSAIHGLANSSDLKPIRRQLFSEPLPKPKYPSKDKGILHFSNVVKGWCLPFPGADRSVVRRTQYHLHHKNNIHPAQINAYFKCPSLLAVLLVVIFAGTVGLLSKFKLGRYLLEKYPTFFTCGVVSRQGPTREEMEASNVKIILFGEGWHEKLAQSSDEHSNPPSKRMKLVFSSNIPGYGATGILLIQAALATLRESDKMPSTGGVYTPGTAFAKTTLVHMLNDVGLTFDLFY